MRYSVLVEKIKQVSLEKDKRNKKKDDSEMVVSKSKTRILINPTMTSIDQRR